MRTPAGPFGTDDEAAFRAWRGRKLDAYPTGVGDLLVEVRDPCALSPGELAAMRDRCRRANMVVYAAPPAAADRRIPVQLGAQFGLRSLDRNWLADDDGVSEVRVADDPGRGDFIPYTDRPIRWHTDGYYNPPQRRIRAMVLHCVRNAAQGGENALLDPEIAYLQLRDEDPAHVRALMREDAMTIPERSDDGGVARPAQAGPVFSVDPEDGHLHMRYTARTRSIEWSPDPAVRAAVAALERLLARPSPWIHRITLSPGMGILCNNVLHDRTGFTDDPARPRLVLRARFHERIGGTTAADVVPDAVARDCAPRA
jgi:hypothetical protein